MLVSPVHRAENRQRRGPMAIESSDPCPCGSNKKIKFCCGNPIAPELDKLSRSLEGEQYIAALERLNSLIGEHGPLPCLLALKGLTLKIGRAHV